MSDSEYIGQCAVCFGDVDKKTDAYLLATKIFMVWPIEISIATSPPAPEDDYYCVHLLCWQIRQVIPESRSLAHCKRKPVPVPLEEIETCTCHVCGSPCGPNAAYNGGLVHLATCTHPFSHLTCIAATSNMRRKFMCDERACLVKTQMTLPYTDRQRMCITRWSGLREETVYDVVRMIAPRPFAHDLDEIELDNIFQTPMIELIERRESTTKIIAAYAHLKGTDTPVKRLVRELAARKLPPSASAAGAGAGSNEHDAERRQKYTRSPLVFMNAYKYIPTQMLALGLTFDMLFESRRDWALVLDRELFPTDVLLRVEMNATFMRLLLAGMDMSLFAAAGYTRAELLALQFNARAFMAGGGTRDELCRILSVEQLSECMREFGLVDVRLNDK